MNQYDQQLSNEFAAAQTAAAAGVYNADGQNAINQRGGQDANRRPFDFLEAIPTPAPATSAQIAAFRVPDGYRAIVTGYQLLYTGGGLQQGSGDLVFTISIDGAALRFFESITTERGSLEAPRPIPGGIVLEPGQVFAVAVAVDAAASITTGPGAQCIAGATGVFYPI